MRRVLALLPLVLLAAACGGGSSSPPTTAPSTTVPPTTVPPTTVPPTTTPAGGGTTTATAPAKKKLRVVITAESHHPRLGHTWSYEVRVTDAATGKPVPAHIHLQFVFAGAPVGEVGKHFVTDGVWKETIPAKGKNAFPPAAVGPQLVLRATVTAKGYATATAGWKLSVVK